MKLLKQIIEYSFYLFLIILPIQTRLIIKEGSINDGYFEYGTMSLYGSDLLLVGVLVLASIYFYKKRGELLKSKFNKIWFSLALFEIIAFVSIFFSIDHWLSLYKYSLLLLAIGLFAFVIFFPLNKMKIIISLCLSVLVQSLVAISQFMYQTSPANKWLGMSEKLPYELGVSVVEAMGNKGWVERWLRAPGMLDHPNILGGFLTIFFIFLFTFLIINSKKIYKKTDDLYRSLVFRFNIYFYPLLIIIGIAIFFSFSRAAWLGTVVFSFFFLLIIAIKKDKVSLKFYLPVLLYLVAVLFVVSIPFNNLIEARVFGKSKVENISKYERFRSTEIAKKILKDNWLYGVGLGNYTLAVKEKYPDNPSYFYQPVHNTYLLVWAELGLVGFMSFLSFLILVFFNSWKKRGMPIEYVLPLFIALSAMLFFDHWWFSLHFGIYFLFLSLALSTKHFELD